MLKKCILLMSFFSVGLLVYSQNMNIVWQKVIGGSNWDVSPIIINSPGNDGYYLIGYSRSNISGDKTENSFGGDDVWVVKVDNDGNKLWDKTFGGDQADSPVDAKVKNDTIYVLAKTFSGISGNKSTAGYGLTDAWLIALDLDGNLLFEQTYGGSDYDSPKNLAFGNNYALLIAIESSSTNDGVKTSVNIGNYDLWLLNIDRRNGSISSQASFGTSDWDEFSKLETDASGNVYLLAATSVTDNDKTVSGFGSYDIWLLKLDQNLTKLDEGCYGGSDSEYGGESDILVDGTDIYIVCSSQSDVSGNKTAPRYGGSTTRDYWLFRLDNNLDMVWDYTFGGDGGSFSDQSYVLEKNNDMLFIVGLSRTPSSTGTKTSPYYGNTDIWVVVTDLNGIEIAQGSYGGTEYDSAKSATFDSDGYLFIAGTSNSNISGNKTQNSKGSHDYWLLKIDARKSVGVYNISSNQ
ncbi:MAG: hypothetical protein ACLGGV_09590, partial [Bacteroidia bacterium]